MRAVTGLVFAIKVNGEDVIQIICTRFTLTFVIGNSTAARNCRAECPQICGQGQFKCPNFRDGNDCEHEGICSSTIGYIAF